MFSTTFHQFRPIFYDFLCITKDKMVRNQVTVNTLKKSNMAHNFVCTAISSDVQNYDELWNDFS